MGFWSALGGIAGAAAAPFTGGASLAMLPVINGLTSDGGQAVGNVGQVAGSAANAAAQNRVQQGQLINQQNANATGLYNAEQNAAKQGSEYALSAPASIARNAVRGDILSNGKDASFSGLPSYLHVPTTTGGLRPSMLSDTTRQMGTNLTRDSMLAQLAGEKNGYAMPGAPTAPTPQGLPQPGGLESTLSGVGLAGGLTSAASPIIQQLLKSLMTKPKGGAQTGGAQTGADWSDEGIG